MRQLRYGRPFSPGFLFVLLLCLIGGISAGCSPKIGDDCTSSTDCSMSGERLCDTTLPGGYCTVFNCEPDTCPDESQCVAFDTALDPRCKDHRWARFERTFCMRRCSRDGDCRKEYVCADMSEFANPWGAQVVDTDPKGAKICVPPWSESTPAMGMTEVCDPYEGSWPDVPTVSDASTFEDTGSDVDAPDDAGVDAGEDVADDVADDASHDTKDDAAEDVAGDSSDDVEDGADGDVGEDVLLDVLDDREDEAGDGQEGG